MTLLRINFDDREAAHKPRVLMLCHRIPWPLDRGDRIRAYHMLEHMAGQFEVDIACTSDTPPTHAQRTVLQKLAGRVAIQRLHRPGKMMHAAAALAAGRAITPACFYRSGIAGTLVRWHRQRNYDTVLTYCTSMIGYARVLMRRNPRPRHVIDLVDVDSFKWRQYAQQVRAPMRWVYAAEARRLARIEAGQLDHFDAVTVVSDAEANLYRRHVGEHPGLTVLRHAVDVDFFAPLPDAGGSEVVFIGGLDYRPNIEGITWFVESVMPLLVERVADIRLRIVGRDPAAEVRSLHDDPHVKVVGPVDDVRTELRRACVVIAALHTACGVQTKVLEAMAAARAVICSPGAAEGILADDGKHLVIARDRDEWAARISRLLHDSNLRRRIAQAARARIETIYPWRQCLEPLGGIITGQPQTESEDAPAPQRRAA